MIKEPLDFLIIIQARIGSTRLPNKVMQMVGGKTILRRVWNAANEAKLNGTKKVIVAWPERYPDLDESNVLERFKRISNEFPSTYLVRLTSDCPLLRPVDIEATVKFVTLFEKDYDGNHIDGFDVQVFKRSYLFDSRFTHREHVINDFTTKDTGLSVNTKEDLERVRQILCKTK